MSKWRERIPLLDLELHRHTQQSDANHYEMETVYYLRCNTKQKNNLQGPTYAKWYTINHVEATYNKSRRDGYQK